MPRSEFQFHRLNENAIETAKQIAESFTALLDYLEGTVGTTGREIAIVRTKLEEASFFAKKALAVREENQA
jgi:hypothetical protein